MIHPSAVSMPLPSDLLPVRLSTAIGFARLAAIGWPASCVLACIEAIERVMSVAEPIAVDKLRTIVDEYLRNLSMAGQPGIGDQFAKWVHDNQGQPETCVHVPITPDEDSFDELSTELTELVDPSDRKFVAAAIAHGTARILEATDSKWWGWQEKSSAAGAVVKFLYQPDRGAAREEDG
jgi:hypothetical protein